MWIADDIWANIDIYILFYKFTYEINQFQCACGIVFSGKGPDPSEAPVNLQDFAYLTEDEGGLRRLNGGRFDVGEVSGALQTFKSFF